MDAPRKPTNPTAAHPLSQLDWLVAKAIELRPGRDNEQFVSTRSWYARFFLPWYAKTYRHDCSHGFDLRTHWGGVSVAQFRECVELYKKGALKPKISGAYARALIQHIRTLSALAVRYELTNGAAIAHVSVPHARRETQRHEALAESELKLILDAIAPAIVRAKAVSRPYIRQGIGADPRIRKNGGFKVEANLVWFFENVLDCKPIPSQFEKGHSHTALRLAIKKRYGSTLGFYDKLGITRCVDGNLLYPLMYKLAAETGLNVGAVVDLKRDCYIERHPLHGMAVLRYPKPRLLEEKELLLPLLDAEETLCLTSRQSVVVAKTIELIRAVTEPLVALVPEADRSCLWLGEKETKGTFGRMQKVSLAGWSNKTLKPIVRERNGGKEIAVNLARMRPTRITQMVKDGHDIFEIQAVAGHASVLTTMRYLTSHNLEKEANEGIHKALKAIYANSYTASQPQTVPAPSQGSVFPAALCNCKNPFDPPPSVKKASTYRAGQPCTYYNMCLRCPNVVVMKEHLPGLLALRRDIRAALLTNAAQTPHSRLLRLNQAILDNLLDPEQSEFPSADLKAAEEIMRSSDLYTDPSVFVEVAN